MDSPPRSPSRADASARRRWAVHLALIVGFLAAVGSAVVLSRKYLGHAGTTNHSIIGLVVLALILIHLAQRRRTVGRLFAALTGRKNTTGRARRQASSDLVLWLLTLNVMVSGVADFLVGHTIFLPIPGPNLLQKWHAAGVVVLLIYVIVHVLRRRKRLRRSHIS